jgi:hypothetical protein
MNLVTKTPCDAARLNLKNKGKQEKEKPNQERVAVK